MIKVESIFFNIGWKIPDLYYILPLNITFFLLVVFEQNLALYRSNKTVLFSTEGEFIVIFRVTVIST